MTVYECSTCRKTHDTAKDPPCPQVFTVVAQTEPTSPDESQPSWMRRHFCPQCPRHRQPRDGFDVADFQEHVASHAALYLREAEVDAFRMFRALESIERLLSQEFVERWPALAVRRDVMARVGQGLHWKDDAWQARFDAKYLTAIGPDACSACGQALPAQAAKAKGEG